MPFNKIYKESYELGKNDRDFPTDISPKSCQLLENAFPGAPNLRPRHGISEWNSFWDYHFDSKEVSAIEVIPWDEETGTVIVIDSRFWVWAINKNLSGETLISTMAESCHPLTKFHWTRNQDFLYIITNYASNNASYIIEEKDSVIIMRKANITKPSLNIQRISVDNLSENLSKPYFSISASLVRRAGYPTNPPLGNLAFPDDAFDPGDLESISSTDDQFVFNEPAGIGFTFKITVTGTLDTQANFIRVYVSALADSEDIALGNQKQWFIDMPITAHNNIEYFFVLTVNDFETLVGSLDVLKTVGYDNVPAGSYITSHLGRLWIGGKVEDEDETQIRGRWYYSSDIQDLLNPKKWASMFELTSGFIDTSLDDQEDGSCCGVHGNDLIFIMTRNTVWKLINGDITLSPQLLSSSKGSKFPRSLVKIDEMLMYLSNDGPCYLEGDSVNTMREFTASEVWPYNWKNEPGYFFNKINPHNVRSFYYKGTWWIHSGYKIVGMYMPTDQKGFGPMTVFPAWSEIIADRVAVLGFDKCCFFSNHPSTGTKSWFFLDPDTFTDNGYDYKVRTISKGFYVNKANPDLLGELYDILVHIGYTDIGALRIKITTDNDRVLHSIEYTQKNSGTMVDSSVANSRRSIIQQGFIEGLIGRVFQVEIVKEFRKPYDFHSRGFVLHLKQIPESDFEYQHDDNQPDAGVHDALDEYRSIGSWLIESKIKDAGDSSRNILNYNVRDAGTSETRLLNGNS